MCRHILVPIDCSEDARRIVPALARFAARMPSCQFTLVAPVTPAPTPELRESKQAHARTALHMMHYLLQDFGVYAFCRIAEGMDAVAATLETSQDAAEQFDLILLGAYQTRPEVDEFPCQGSFADKLCRYSRLPVYILPAPRNEK